MKLTIPSQDALIDPTLETQPKNLRDWVQTLPYISPANASKMARENLQKLNRIPLPIGRRLELLECSADAYWRILEAVVEHPEPQGKMAREQDPLLGLLQGFCQDLAYGYKIAVHDGQGKSSLFGRGRQQQQAVLLAIEYLGQVLNHRYALYQCPSESLWAEVDQLYRFARKRKIHLNPIAGQRGVRCSIEHAYLQVLLLKIGDPFRLPKNSLWEVLRYLQLRTSLARIQSFSDTQPPSGNIPLPASMCDADGDAQLLFLEISELITSVEQDLKALDEGYRPKSLGFGAQLSTADAQQILLQLLAGWTQQVQRKAEREDLQADAEFAVGLESCFYFLNRGQAFNRSGFVTAPHNEKDREASSWEQNERPEFPTLSGHILNRSAGGIAVHCNQPRSNAPRVGQLLAIRSRHRSHNQAGVWFIASTRWLKVENADSFEMGAQYLAREAIPVAVRAFAEHVGNSEFHAALRIDTQQGDKTWQILITPCGFFASGRELELVRGGCREKIRCLQLFESGTGYERFRYEVVNTRNGSATTPGPG